MKDISAIHSGIMGQEFAVRGKVGLVGASGSRHFGKHAQEGHNRITQGPALDIDVITGDDKGNEETQDADIFGQPIVPEEFKNGWCGAMPSDSSVATDGPFHPHKRDGDEDQGNHIGDHEDPATVLSRLGRETEKITQTHSISRHG